MAMGRQTESFNCYL